MLFIPITIAAAALQVARNACQRSLMTGGGAWGATLVRFLFGLPFSFAFLAAAWLVWPDAAPRFTGLFWAAALAGAVGQIAATALLLVSMHRAGFGLAAVFQQSSLPLAVVVGWAALGEGMSAAGWLGVAMTTAGLLALSWPRGGWEELFGAGSGALLGLASGACYAVVLNAYRVANIELEPNHPLFASVLSNTITQGFQTAVIVAWLLVRDPAALRSVLATWRASLGAGFFGSAASALWGFALAIAPAGQVRAVGVVEMPIAALAGRKLFAERMSWKEIILSAAVAVGVVLAALG